MSTQPPSVRTERIVMVVCVIVAIASIPISVRLWGQIFGWW